MQLKKVVTSLSDGETVDRCISYTSILHSLRENTNLELLLKD